MSKRHEAVGIKQIVRFEGAQKAVNLLLAGLDPEAIRQELQRFYASGNGNGIKGIESKINQSFSAGNLMKIWVTPEPELVPFRDAALVFLRKNPSLALAVHWGMVSAAYPFWFNVARQTGRLLALQEQVTHAQIVNRLKEQYGDRRTVSQYAQYVIRSFVAWGVLQDTEGKGCYAKAAPVSITDTNLTALLLESALLATPGGKGALGQLGNSPAFFPFQLPLITGDLVRRHSDRVEVVQHSLNDELLVLKVPPKKVPSKKPPSNPLQDHRRGHAPRRAHGDQAELLVGALQLIDHGADED